MNTTPAITVRAANRPSHRLALPLAAALTLALGLSAPVHQARATGMPVFDASSLIQMVIDYQAKLSQWYTTVEQYQKEVASFQAQIAQITNIAYAMGIKPGQSLEPVADDYLVTERCGAGKGVLGSLNPLKFGANDDLQEQQLALCASIQMMHNRKYNDTVKFLADNQKEMVKELNQFNAQAATANNLGNSSKSAQSGVSLTAAQQGRINNYQTQMQAYDSYIDSLENTQRVLAKSALKGKKSNQLIGTLVKTATLKTALELGGVSDEELRNGK